MSHYCIVEDTTEYELFITTEVRLLLQLSADTTRFCYLMLIKEYIYYWAVTLKYFDKYNSGFIFTILCAFLYLKTFSPRRGPQATFYFIGTGSCFVAQAGFKIMTLLPQSPTCQNYRYMPQLSAHEGIFDLKEEQETFVGNALTQSYRHKHSSPVHRASGVPKSALQGQHLDLHF